MRPYNNATSLLHWALIILIGVGQFVSISGCQRIESDLEVVSVSEQTHSADAALEKPLGIGFLFTQNNHQAVAMLSSENDFVDLIIGPGRLDVFDSVKPPARVVCIARSLERNEERPFPGVRETIEILKNAGIPADRVIIGYNPERQPGTPVREMDELVESVRRAREIVNAYGAPLLVGPGLRDMQTREHLYPELARYCDIWLIQSQRLQMEPATGRVFTTEEYRREVVKIAESLRSGNPEIKIIAQLVAGGRVEKEIFSAGEVAAYARSIEDIVDAVRIYGGSGEVVCEIIERIRVADIIQAD